MGIQEQYFNAVPPRKGAIIRLTLDTTARAYSIASLAFGGYTPDAGNSRSSYVYLQLQAVTANCHIQFAGDNTVTLDDTAAVSAGGTLAFANTYCDTIPAGSIVPVRIDRKVDTYLHVKGSAAGTLIIRAFSEAL